MIKEMYQKELREPQITEGREQRLKEWKLFSPSTGELENHLNVTEITDGGKKAFISSVIVSH